MRVFVVVMLAVLSPQLHAEQCSTPQYDGERGSIGGAVQLSATVEKSLIALLPREAPQPSQKCWQVDSDGGLFLYAPQEKEAFSFVRNGGRWVYEMWFDEIPFSVSERGGR